MTAAAVFESEAVALLHALNSRFVRALGERDLQRLGARLSDDFVCTLGDGRRVRKAAFLSDAKGAVGSDVRCEEVDVRVLGGVGLVDGVLRHTQRGEQALARYTTVWQDVPGLGWVAVAAHFTPVCAAASSNPAAGRKRSRPFLRRRA